MRVQVVSATLLFRERSVLFVAQFLTNIRSEGFELEHGLFEFGLPLGEISESIRRAIGGEESALAVSFPHSLGLGPGGGDARCEVTVDRAQALLGFGRLGARNAP